MKNEKVIEQICNTWKYQRKILNDFLDCIPADKWLYSHHQKVATLDKQFRHMVWVYGAYIDAIENRKIDLTKKKTFYDGTLERDQIRKAFEGMDSKFFCLMDQLKSEDLDNFQIDFFGQEMGLIEFSHVMVQHDSVHMGIWANGAYFGGFQTPKSWQDDWGL